MADLELDDGWAFRQLVDDLNPAHPRHRLLADGHDLIGFDQGAPRATDGRRRRTFRAALHRRCQIISLVGHKQQVNRSFDHFIWI